MKNAFLLCLLFCLYWLPVRAVERVSTYRILTILKQKDGPVKQRQLILALRHYFDGRPVSDWQPAKKILDSLLLVYPVTDAPAIRLLVETIYRMQLKQFADAEKTLTAAIELADRENDHYLLYACFTQLAFLQTGKGYMPDAVASFRQARDEAVLLNDAYLEVQVDINISEIYYRNKLHGQSLIYLNQAEKLMRLQQIGEPVFSMMILVNKGQNYFELGQADSLAKYSRLLSGLKVPDSRLYTYQQRSSYSLQLLMGRYKEALARIIALKHDERYTYAFVDDKNLAATLYKVRELDAAWSVLTRLLADTSLANHPEETEPLHEMLGHISMKQADKSQAALHFDMALQQAKMQIKRLIEVDTVAARLKLDEVRGNYIRREESFRRERIWLMVCIVAICLISVSIAILYRTIRQKRHFESLLFESKRNELAFINSHEVRRHLANILGIIDTISSSNNKHESYLEVETHLLKAATALDRSIRSIADKLDG